MNNTAIQFNGFDGQWLLIINVFRTLLLTGTIAFFAGRQAISNGRLADIQERLMVLNQPSIIATHLRHERLKPIADHSGTEGWGLRLMNPSRIPMQIHSAGLVTIDESGAFCHRPSMNLKKYSEENASVGTDVLPLEIGPGRSVEIWIEISVIKLTPRASGVMLLLYHAEGVERVSLRAAREGPDPMTDWKDSGVRIEFGGFPKGSLGNKYIEYRMKNPDKYGDSVTWYSHEE